MHHIRAVSETISPAMTWYRVLPLKARNLAMAGPSADDNVQIDRRTSRSICDAVGERLQQSLRPEPRLPTNLEQLLNELQRREREPH
ncbi:hypothetical protein [Bradyrhizobium vignae]|uniref:hypothetical protein n=1 Tax=Bradyrhizobium TaxID=374 RepID=UPI00100BC0AE|nr:hypothetical protein [Bradyrhizobium vignae]RXH05603.1 hypothetical protein EAV90_06635 [Bradyrhizobium vignae]